MQPIEAVDDVQKPRTGRAAAPEQPGPSLIERFARYAFAFERVLDSDDWASLAEYFTPAARRRVVGGGLLAADSFGRDALIADLRAGVEAVDRRFDRRLPEILCGPSEREGAVWMDWRLTLQRDGLPDLVIEGTHAAYYDGERIRRIDEALTQAMTERVAAYLERHDAQLRPAPSSATGAQAVRRPERARRRELVEAYARAKSRADVEGALAVCHESFRLETVPFDIASHDRAETAAQLHLFFRAFPDYGVRVDDMAFGEASVACWGTAHLTLRGELLGLAPTHRRAEIAFVSVFTFADGQLAGERFFFDLAALCDGIGVSIEALRAALVHARGAVGRVVAGG